MFGLISNIEIGLSMSKYNISPQCECQISILNVKIRYSALFRMSKEDYECQYSIFRLSANVKIGL